MKMRYNKISAFIILVAISISCTEVVEIDLDSTYDRLVVYGKITTDYERHYVELTTTADYFYNEEPKAVTGANVTIMAGDSLFTLEESAVWPGIYQMSRPYSGREGVSYQLEIRNVDIDDDGEAEHYTAVSKMPVIEDPDSISLEKFVTPFFSGTQVTLWSPEAMGTNFYNFQLARNGELIHKRLSQYTVQPDDFFTDNYIAGLPIGFLDDDDDDEVVVPGDIVTLVVSSITEDYYSFITEAQNEIFGNNPLFSGPPANVSSNIEGDDAVGIFTTYSIARTSRVVPVPAFSQK